MSKSNQNVSRAVTAYQPAIVLAPFVQGWGYRVLKTVFALGVLCGLLGVVYVAGPAWLAGTTVPWLAAPLRLYVGLVLVAAGCYGSLQLLHYFFNSYYFRGLDSLIHGETSTSGIVYEVAHSIYHAPDDVTAGFIHSRFGRTVLKRVGVDAKTAIAFVASSRERLSIERVTVPSDRQVTLALLAKLLLEQDGAFRDWLQSQAVRATSFLGAVAWTHREHVAKKRQERWWSKDQLSQKTGLGRDFIYGVPYTLNRYSKSLSLGLVYRDRAERTTVHPHIVQAVEQQLVQPGAGNVLLVGAPGVGKLDIVATVADRLAHGQAIGSVTSPQIHVLDTEHLLAAAETTVALEQTFLQLLQEAAAAGNTIIVIDDLSGFIAGAARHGVVVDTLLDEYLASTSLRVIATSAPEAYHSELETKSQLLRYFHTEMVTAPDVDTTLTILQTLAATYQAETGITCTYQALERIASAADRYVVNGVMPDKAIHLFDEITTSGTTAANYVQVADVDAYISDSTGIPVGPLDAEERAMLLDLEQVLHRRIVGQDAAVAAISSVMRRARADIQASDKPLGSFLFMGPTGVGKTESAKALAEVFFKSEDNLHRFDMTEYSGSDALARLIGTTTTAGTLSTALTEQPYAVVLLDEFEKAAESVHDVFLQILDEGQFTNGRGQRINARTTIIIATSNAGSEKITEWLAAGMVVAEQQSELISHVIEAGVYKPELVNRFDDVVVFTPLTQSEQHQIARQLLDELAERIEAKGYRLSITDDLVDTVAKLGYDTDFGARPMRRAIQTAVEDLIAKKVIAGALAPGDTITFTAEELDTFTA